MKTIDGNHIIIGRYGVSEVVGFSTIDLGGIVRDEVYYSADGGGIGNPDRGTHAAHFDDLTDTAERNIGRCVCGLCFLGAPHTVALHKGAGR